MNAEIPKDASSSKLELSLRFSQYVINNLLKVRSSVVTFSSLLIMYRLISWVPTEI